MYNWYIAGSGKNQRLYDFLAKRIPTIGYTLNGDVNLFIAAKKVYIDAHTHYGQRLDGVLRQDYEQYIQPIMPDFALGTPDEYRYGDRERALNRLERQMDKVLEYLEDKNLGFRTYEFWVNDATGDVIDAGDGSVECPQKDGWRREAFGKRGLMEKWLQDKRDAAQNRRDLGTYLAGAKRCLRALGADEGAKVIEELIKKYE